MQKDFFDGIDPRRTSAHWSGGRRLRRACHPTVDLSAKRNKIDWFRQKRVSAGFRGYCQ
jgi:hypothetical protein